MQNSTTYMDLFRSEKPVLVGFSQKSSATSSEVDTLLEEVRGSMEYSTVMMHLDLAHNEKIAKDLGIKTALGFVLFDKGQLKWQQEGIPNSGQVKYLLNLAHIGQLDINEVYGN